VAIAGGAGNHRQPLAGRIGVRSYKHADRKRGTIYNPVLAGVDWVPASAVLDKNDAAPSFEDHRSEKSKKHRKASL
jgi:hypothetical protein